ncbi:MAG TPA: hypothetical protein VHX37_15935 [Acidobacteriaceae bacterium]|nr:hypothetical protein [Acidobacteriaceae bacterium]
MSDLAGNGGAITSSASSDRPAVPIDAGGRVRTIGWGTYPLEKTHQTGTVPQFIGSSGGLEGPLTRVPGAAAPAAPISTAAAHKTTGVKP